MIRGGAFSTIFKRNPRKQQKQYMSMEQSVFSELQTLTKSMQLRP